MSKIVLKGRLFTGEELIEEAAVVVDEELGIIEEVGPQSDTQEYRDAKLIEVKDTTILPGLIDAHVHFFGSQRFDLIEWVTANDALAALRSIGDLRRVLYAGFTAVRDLGSKAGIHLSKAIKEGVVEGPTVVSCSKSLAQTGGDDDPIVLPIKMAQELSYSYYCDGPWECRRAVRMVLRDGGEVVKVYASGASPQGGATRVQFTLEELRAIADEAHRSGLKVAAHAIGEQAIVNAVDAGVDSIEHGVGLTPEIAKEIRHKGIYYVPTLSVFHAVKLSGDPREKALVEKHFSEDLQIAKDYGLKVVCGSDCVGADFQRHGENYREIVDLAGALGNKEALVAATSRAAECLGLHKSGHIKKGYQADLVVVGGNPLRDIQTLAPQNVVRVLKAGKIFTPG
jgi:imidazolonepropionase-like amidohydrolase